MKTSCRIGRLGFMIFSVVVARIDNKHKTFKRKAAQNERKRIQGEKKKE